MNLNFKISELLYSAKAKEKKIDNIANIEALDNLLELICFCLQPIREKLNKPMIITSGYRCKKLNDIVGGAPNSKHLKGQAADFIVKDMSIKEVVNFIKNSGVEFDELINEYDKWVHISFVKNKNRRKIIKI